MEVYHTPEILMDSEGFYSVEFSLKAPDGTGEILFPVHLETFSKNYRAVRNALSGFRLLQPDANNAQAGLTFRIGDGSGQEGIVTCEIFYGKDEVTGQPRVLLKTTAKDKDGRVITGPEYANVKGQTHFEPKG